MHDKLMKGMVWGVALSLPVWALLLWVVAS